MIWADLNNYPTDVSIIGADARHSWGRRPELLQLRGFSFGVLQDGNVGIGIFPEREEILVRSVRLGRVTLHGISASDLEMRQGPNRGIQNNSAMVENFLELSGGCFALMGGQIGFSADIDRIQGRPAVSTVSRLS